jgi:cell division protein FtsW
VALKKFSSDLFFLKKQAIYCFIGILALVLFSHISYRLYRPLTYPFLFLSFALLIAVQFDGVGLSLNGSARWLRLGPVSFQPSEAARLALIIFLAYSLSKKQEAIKIFTIGFLPHAIVLAVFAVLLMQQPDFGSMVIFAALTWLIMFVGGVPLRHLVGPLLPVIPIFYYLMISKPYRLERWSIFLNPWKDPTDKGYQIIHSMMAFGTGGIWGAGIGNGSQKLFYLPEPHTDFIFAVIGEEMGFWGVLLVLGLYSTILWRGMRIAHTCADTFGMLLATGITFALALQVSVNMGVCLGLLPTKGLTLPFLSYGGTSLVLNMASIGILMNIGARHDQRA